MSVAESLFWISLSVIGYTYVGYPLILWLWSQHRTRPVNKKPFAPSVSVVIAACNEAPHVGLRIENILGLDFPTERLEIIVVSDGSTDGTPDIINRYAGDRVRLIALAERRGKAAALNVGVAQAKGEIIVFSDARQTFDKGAIRELTANFRDPQVGAVSGELVLMEPSGMARHNTGLYWRYEKWIRKAESRVDSVIGATGAIYAIRKSQFVPLPIGTLLDDVMIPMRIALQRYRVLFEENALAYDTPSASVEQEFQRKVRTLTGNYQLLFLMPELWSPMHNRLFFQYFSHKVTRLSAPFALMALFISSLILMRGIYAVGFVLQTLCYGLAWVGWQVRYKPWRTPVISLPLTFVMMNCAALLGLVQFLRGLHNDRAGLNLWAKG